MKQALVLLLFATVLTACIKIEDPTIFEGKVVYEDDGSPAVGVKLEIYAVFKKPFFSFGTQGSSGERKNKIIGADGAFNFKYSYNKEISHFELNVLDSVIDPTIQRLVPYYSKTDCSPYDCEGLQPHQNYSDLVIKIDRP